MTNYPLPKGATYVPGMRAGEWKARRAAAQQRHARKAADAEGDRLRGRMLDRMTWGAALAHISIRREAAEAQVAKVIRSIAILEQQIHEDPRHFSKMAPARAELEIVKEMLDRLRAAEEAERVKLEARIAAADAQDAVEAAERDRQAARTAAADAQRAKLEARIAAAEAQDAAEQKAAR